MRGACLNVGSDFHLLDHIAPLAALATMPLIITEEKNFTLVRRYYPHVEVRYQPNLENELGLIADEFDTLFECKYWLAHLKSLFYDLYRKKMQLIFCPHGQSDKGFQTPLLAPYPTQDGVLIYGDLMIQMLKTLGIWSQIRSFAKVGNFRLAHYQQHQTFYDDLVEQEVFCHLVQTKPTLLYAPTWKDADGATSFFDWSSRLIEELSSDWNLIVKVHPLLEQRNPSQFYPLASKIEKRANTLLVLDFPPVYPILARCDVYVGDFSSVGYDFLSFQKPMFFFPHPNLAPQRLQNCGKFLKKIDEISLENSFSQKQKELYALAFDSLSTQRWQNKGDFKLFKPTDCGASCEPVCIGPLL